MESYGNGDRRRAKRIGVDYDGVSRLRLLMGYFNAHYFFPEARIDVKETLGGYHLRIHIHNNIEQNFTVRRSLFDDPIRLEFDEDRLRKGLSDWIDTIFNIKWSREGISVELSCNPLAEPFYSRMPANKTRRVMKK